MTTPTTNDPQQPYEQLWIRCRRFVEDQHIRAPESVYQQDNVIENAYELIADICALVGYYEDPDDD